LAARGRHCTLLRPASAHVTAVSACRARCWCAHGIREAVSYQPASRYWAFQWTEAAIYLALALALAGYCFRRLGRRLS
jgi:hypothetical protein